MILCITSHPVLIKIAKDHGSDFQTDFKKDLFHDQDVRIIPNYLKSEIKSSLMSTNPERAVSYVLSKYVSEYMDKDVLILSMNTQTREAARMLRHYETDDIVVTDEKNLPVGIVTDEDILNKVSDATVYAEATHLRDVMTTPLITINEKSTLQDALHKMRDNNIRKLPVISKKNQVSRNDFSDCDCKRNQGCNVYGSASTQSSSKGSFGKSGFCSAVCRSSPTGTCNSCYGVGGYGNRNRNLSDHSAFVGYRVLSELVRRKVKSELAAGVNTRILKSFLVVVVWNSAIPVRLSK